MRSRPGSRDPHFHAGSRTARPMHYRARCSTSFSSLRRSPSLPWPGPTSASAIGSRERHEPRIRHRSRRGLGPRHLPGLRASRAGAVPAMTAVGWAQIALYFLVLLLLIKPAGAYMFRVFEGNRQPLPAVFGRVERFIYRVCGVDPEREQRWTGYAFSLLAFSLLGLLVTYAIERLQHLLPLNPQQLGPLEPTVAFNTAASFTTNTNWQSYTPESTKIGTSVV